MGVKKAPRAIFHCFHLALLRLANGARVRHILAACACSTIPPSALAHQLPLFFFRPALQDATSLLPHTLHLFHSVNPLMLSSLYYISEARQCCYVWRFGHVFHCFHACSAVRSGFCYAKQHFKKKWKIANGAFVTHIGNQLLHYKNQCFLCFVWTRKRCKSETQFSGTCLKCFKSQHFRASYVWSMWFPSQAMLGVLHCFHTWSAVNSSICGANRSSLSESETLQTVLLWDTIDSNVCPENA